jgi:integrase
MKNKRIKYYSVFSPILSGYVEEKRAVGYKFNKGASLLRQFDNLLVRENVTEQILTKEIVQAWTQKREGESDSTRNGRISIIRGLGLYMVRLKYQAYIYPDKATHVNRHQYVPYIFSESELAKIFTAADMIQPLTASPLRHFILPLLFRMLYGCGLRISEALNLMVCDIDLKAGTLTIRQAKHDKDRIIPMAESLTERSRQYLQDVHSGSMDETYFFPSPHGGRYSADRIYDYFRSFLWAAGISHGGRGHGPRLHDFRHTFSVHCLKKWVLNKNDLTVLLPYLSTYLGHVDLRSSQYYLRLTADLYPSVLSAVESKFSSIIPEVDSYETN